MQETYDFHTIIIIITFLGILVGISFFINKKKDYFKRHFKNNNTIDIISSSLIGSGNKVIVFSVYKKQYLIVASKNNISNILDIDQSSIFNNENKLGTRNEKLS